MTPTDTDGLAYCRFPTIHGDRITFSAEGNLWEVGIDGGNARRLTSSTAVHTHPRYSPNGKWIAFSSADEGPVNAWVMPAEGGPARRLTFTSAPTNVVGWTPDGSRVVVSALGIEGVRAWSLASVPVTGGALRIEPYGRGDGIAYHPDGRRVAVHRHAHDPAWWKRYAGGRAGRIWLGDLETGEFHKLPGGPRTDCQPMWIGDTLWFLSDQDGMGDIWRANADGTERRRVTSHAEHYARHPQADGDRIVYSMGGRIHVLETDAPDPAPREVPVRALGHSFAGRRKFVPVADAVQSFGLNADGSEALFTIRGQVVRLPAWHGSPRVVAGAPGVRFRDAHWLGSTDSIVSIAQLDDADEVVLLPAEGIDGDLAKLRRLGGVGRRIRELRPSPDGKRVAVLDQGRGVHVMEVAGGTCVTVDDEGAGWARGAAWSPCSTWLAFTRTETWWRSSLHVWGGPDATCRRVGSREFGDSAPAWDPAGRYLAFLSARHLDPHASEIDHDLGFPAATRAYVVTLRADEPVPFAPEVKAPKEAPERVTEPIAIDFEGISERVRPLPFEAGRYAQVGCSREGVAVLRAPLGRMREEWHGKDPHDRNTVELFKFADRKRDKALDGCGDWAESADGTRWLHRVGERFRLLDAATKPKDEHDDDGERAAPSTGWLALERIALSVAPRAEYRQMLLEAWALQRDHYYDPALARVDWDACRDRYLALVDRVRTREELQDLLWEMQGELGTSHAYAFGGDLPTARKYEVGHLGCDFEQDADGHYRIARVYPGDVWDDGRHSPLAEPGKAVRAGDVLLAVDGRRVGADAHPGEWLLETAGRQVTLTVADDAAGAGRREVVVTPVGDETYLRYRAWVDANRDRVEAETDGRVGYVHIPNMGPEGAMEFARNFLWQVESRRGLIVDNRYNGGGNISGIILSKLLKRPIGWDQSRFGRTGTYPSHSPRGPIVVLTNENAGSDGDMFSQAVKSSGLGPLIGMRTWGGVVGIDMAKDLVDGGLTTQPEYGTWFPGIRWGVENHGVEPDIEVDRTPADAWQGTDPQLARGIEEVERLLETNPGTPPDLGPYPDLRWPPA